MKFCFSHYWASVSVFGLPTKSQSTSRNTPWNSSRAAPYKTAMQWNNFSATKYSSCHLLFLLFLQLHPPTPQNSLLPSFHLLSHCKWEMAVRLILPLNTDPGEINGKNWWVYSSYQHTLVVFNNPLTTLFSTPFIALYLNYTQFLSLNGVLKGSERFKTNFVCYLQFCIQWIYSNHCKWSTYWTN